MTIGTAFDASHCEHVDNQVPWKSISEVPRGFRYLRGARLNVEQANEIYKRIAPRMDMNFALARLEFEKTHRIEGSVWVEGSQPAPTAVAEEPDAEEPGGDA